MAYAQNNKDRFLWDAIDNKAMAIGEGLQFDGQWWKQGGGNPQVICGEEVEGSSVVGQVKRR